MGFNLGAFAGGAAQGSLNTYMSLQQIENMKQEQALRELQIAEAKSNAEEKAGIKSAAASTYGQVGAPETALPGRRLTESEVADAYNIDQGGVPQVPVKKYTRDQADADYLAKVRAINPEKAIDVEAKQLQISGGKRTERYAQKQEMALGLQQSVFDTMKENNGDIPATINTHFIPLVNKGLIPEYKHAEIVDGAMGGKTIIATAKDGTKKTLPADIDTLELLTGKAQELMMASSTPENYWHAKEMKVKETTAAAQMKHADAAMSSAGAAWANAKTNAESATAKNDYWKAAAKKMGQTKAEDMKEAVSVQADLIQKADPNVPRAQAELRAANKLLRSAEDKASVITGEQVQKFLDSPEGDKIKYKTENGRKVKLSSEERQAEALRILRMRTTPAEAIPAGGKNAADAVMERLFKNATDEDFRN